MTVEKRNHAIKIDCKFHEDRTSNLDPFLQFKMFIVSYTCRFLNDPFFIFSLDFINSLGREILFSVICL